MQEFRKRSTRPVSALPDLPLWESELLRARGVEHHPVVFSPEEPMEAAQFEAPPPGRRSVPGSLVWVPASAGMLMCQYIVTGLTGPA